MSEHEVCGFRPPIWSHCSTSGYADAHTDGDFDQRYRRFAAEQLQSDDGANYNDGSNQNVFDHSLTVLVVHKGQKFAAALLGPHPTLIGSDLVGL